MNAKRAIAVSLLPLALLAGCGAGGQGDKSKRPPPQVGFVVVQPVTVPLQTSLGARTVAYEVSEVRPQVNGVIRKRLFTEGGMVRQGQPLFEIDNSLYQASLHQAQANLAAASATAEAASARAARYRPLADQEAISRQEYTDALAQSRQARAAVAQNAAALETARITLRYTTVPAPISGRIGRALATVGALANANQASPLAVIQRMDPIYVDMQQSSAELLGLRRALAGGDSLPGNAAVRLKLEDGSDYGFTGTVQFSEMMVSEATGTVTLRASFPNPRGDLLPGMFVQAQFDQAVLPSAILVPQSAVQRDFSGDAIVFLAGPGDKAVRRTITAERTFGTNWIVTAGLTKGDRVITQGLANLKQGMPIKPVPASTPQVVKSRPAGKSAS